VISLSLKIVSGFFLGWHYEGVLSSSRARWLPMLGFVAEAANLNKKV
jgi:hypothetical protein